MSTHVKKNSLEPVLPYSVCSVNVISVSFKPSEIVTVVKVVILQCKHDTNREGRMPQARYGQHFSGLGKSLPLSS